MSDPDPAIEALVDHLGTPEMDDAIAARAEQKRQESGR